MTEQDRSNERIAYWGNPYLASTNESYRRAQESFQRDDYFTALLISVCYL